jgi:hypothetical protein
VSAIDVIALATVSGALAGGGAGAAVVRLTRPAPNIDDFLDDDLEPDEDERIKEAAEAYATQIGRPDAADLIRGKLRVARKVTVRRRRGRRWSS